ncbi:hypothetical protein [Sabulibacter ruber]|uniref:hypothetical protein n=1 Tax=Sabulibacter ruber TaxID=2811901 RepID=UPI001A979877|nr:hypothetical protein [Sabulibacter ruber]
MIHSGRVTPHGQFKVGANFGGNVATEPISQLKDITEAAIEALANRDSVYYGEQVKVATQAAIAYSLDPVGPTFDFYVRYGLAPRVDVGYKYASGVHVLDAMYQFLGPVAGTASNSPQDRWYGSVGIQYAGQSSDILDKLFLTKLAPVLEFQAKRKDILVPLVFSRSFGQDEEFGNFSFGVAYNHTFLEYGLEPGRLYKKAGGDVEQIEGLTRKQSFPSYGIFVNAKIGAKRIYLLPALSMYYQNYGTYELLENDQVSYSGITIVPSLGVQIGLGQGKAGKR